MNKKRKTSPSSILNFFKKHTARNIDNETTENSPNADVEVETMQLDPGPGTPFISPNDIGLYVDKQLILSEKEQLLNNAWKPEESFKFPSTEFGKRQLKFQYSWLKTRDWLTYSKVLDGAFCKYCFIFSPTGAGKQALPLGKLVRVKYSNWKHALEDFNKHQLTTYHRNCKVDAENFLSIQSGQSSDIIRSLDKSVKYKITENRRLLTPVIKTVIFCGRQGLPLRGHRDGGPVDIKEEEFEKNEGNFRALLKMRVESGDSDLKEHLLTAGKNATYTSSVSQNEIISACNQVILGKLVARLNTAECFSILADETTDVGCIEQLSLCARYVDLEKMCLREDFLQFVPVFELTGKALSETIMGKLRDLGINTDYVYGQGYDGASAMSGVYNGVQKFIKDQAPNALYVHCSSHSLNLAVSSSCSSSIITNCLGTVGKMCEFFNTPKRQSILKKHSEAIGVCKKLKQPSPTRWIQRHDAVNVFCQLYAPILRSLEEISSWSDKDTVTNANLLLCAVSKCEFLIALLVIKEIFSYTLPLTKYLESKKIDLTSAVFYAEQTATEIENIRKNAENEFGKIFKNVKVIRAEEDIPLKVPRLAKRQTARENFPHDNPESYYRRACFIPFVEHFTNQLNERFVSHKKVLSSFEILIDTSKEEIHIDNLFGQYGEKLEAIDEIQLNGEVKVWHQVLKRINSERMDSLKKDGKTFQKINAIQALACCSKEMFPSVHKLLQIMATLPVTSCSAERSFSTLKYLKCYLRNTTSETRLNGLSLLYIHKDIAVTPHEVLDEMAKTSRRIQL